jgi:hypothetical protein
VGERAEPGGGQRAIGRVIAKLVPWPGSGSAQTGPRMRGGGARRAVERLKDPRQLRRIGQR